MSAAPLPDADIRRRIGPWHPNSLPDLGDFEPETNFLVRAAAGSGKTTALVARMVALVRTGVPIEDCTAITFTRKAASEMKARLHQELRTAAARLQANSDVPSDELQHVRTALDALPRCFVGTIHSFCARLLRERPLAAGLPPDFTAGLDDRDREALRQQVWQGYLSDVWAEEPDRVEHIAALGIEPAELVHFFGDLCRYPDLTPYVDGPTNPPNLDDTVDRLRDFVSTWMPHLPTNPGDGAAKPGGAAKALRKAERFLTFRSLSDPGTKAEFIRLFEGLTTTDDRKSTDTDVRGDLTKSHWNDASAAEQLDNEVLPALDRDVVEPALREWKAYAHQQMVAFVQPAVERYAERRRETGQLTYQDLLIHARNLLRDNPAARRALQRRYPRLLVDEFQDTDPIQAELLFYLASRDPSQRDWQKCRPRDGSLFIVGDGKQSIYRFRRADLDVYRTVRETLGAASNGEDIALTSNFRSVEPLLDWCNETFGDLFGTVDAPHQAPYVHFEAARTHRPSGATVRQLPVPYVKGSSGSRDIARRNAEQIARSIAQAREDPSPLLRDATGAPLVHGNPGDFMILTRTTTRLNEFAEALAERGLPFTLAGGRDVGASTELYALLTLLNCIERPQDAVARIAYLRGPLVGLSDDALYRLRTAGVTFDGPYELPEELAAALDPELGHRIRSSYERLRRTRERLDDFRPAAAIERTVDALGLMPRARRSPGLGSLHAGRLLRVLAEVQRLDADGHPWTAIREELQQILDGDRDLDGITLETGTEDAVRLLNVHKAKGLEAPVVFLADPYGGSHPKDPDEHVRREDGELVLPVYKEYQHHRKLRYAPERWATEFQDREAAYQRAEEQRLLYVAATRAENLLIVSRYRSDRWNEDRGYWAPLYPYLDDCPEITVPEPSHTDGSAERPTDLPPSTAASGLAAVADPTYEMRTVTQDLDADSSIGSKGYGRGVGTAVHELFAHVLRRRHRFELNGRSSRLVEAVLEKHDVASQRAVVERMLQEFIEGPLWTVLRSAEVVHVEYPIAERRHGIDETPELVDGTVDLLYRTASGWHLIDHKTDRVRSNPSELLERYRPQLEAYAGLWRKATDLPLDQKGLWVADAGTLEFL